MERTRAYRRKQRKKHIRQKARILEKVLQADSDYRLKQKGRLDKGKVHCSCALCRRKSYEEPKISDLRKKLREHDELELD